MQDAAVGPGGKGMPLVTSIVRARVMIDGIAGRIEAERMALAMTQAELARLVGTHQPVVSLWESGNQEPSLSSAAKIAKALDVTLDYLVFGST